MSKRSNRNSLTQIKYLIFPQGLSVTGHAISILLAAENYIAEVLDNTGTDFGVKIPSFQYPSLTMEESMFRIINGRVIIIAMWLCYVPHFKQVITKITVSR